jgi:hypothetical protein
MRYWLVVSVACWAPFGLACANDSRSDAASLPTLANTPLVFTTPRVATPASAIPPPPTLPVLKVGEKVLLRITNDDYVCTRDAGRCRSYSVTVPSDGRLEVALTSVAGQDSFVSTTDLYVVPGGDYWDTGPGPRLTVIIPVKANGTYEIRMYSAIVPSVELELRASLQ